MVALKSLSDLNIQLRYGTFHAIETNSRFFGRIIETGVKLLNCNIAACNNVHK